MSLKLKGKKKKPRDVENEDLPKRKKKSKKAEVEEDEDLEEDLDEDEDLDDDEDEDDLDDEDEDEDDEDLDDEDEEEEEPPKKSKKAKSKKSSKKEKSSKSKKKSFLKTGKARAAAFKAEEARDAAREKEFNKPRRFFIHENNVDEDYDITFLDGELGEDGLLDTPTFREHSMKLNGRWTQFVSCEDNEPDPIQEGGREPSFCQIFTVIDHTGYTDREEKEHKHIKRPFVCKKKTIKQLLKIAKKRGGLKGCTFTVSRTSKKDPNVGNVFEFEEKRSIKEIAKYLISEGMKKEDALEAVKPFDYENDDVLTYYTADELQELGLCDKQETISTKKANKEVDDLDDDLDDEDLDDELDD